MAGKRLVMGKSPGTGLFAQEPKSHGKAHGTLLHGAARGAQKAPAVDQEEERVNSQLVEILERKCSKLRQRAEEEAEQRAKAEADVQAHAADLAETKRRLDERDQQIRDLCTAQRDSAEHRLAAKQQTAALSEVQAELNAARQALSDRTRELETLRAQVARADADWKRQVVQLVAEVQTSAGRTSEVLVELDASQAENARLKAGALELMGRYESESARRLELEEMFLALEEKKRASDQKYREDVSSAQQKAKQAMQSRKRADDLARQRDEQGKGASAFVEEMQARCESLEAEVKRLRADAVERRRVGPPQVLAKAVGGSSSGAGPADAAAAANAKGGLAPSQPPRLPSRPCSAAPPASTSGGQPSQAPSAGKSAAGQARAAPGAIRRAGSVPARFGREAADTGAAVATRNTSASASAPSSLQPVGARPAGTPAVRPRSCGAARPKSCGTSRPSTAAFSEAADPDIEDGIPSDSEEDSSDGEVLSAVRKA